MDFIKHPTPPPKMVTPLRSLLLEDHPIQIQPDSAAPETTTAVRSESPPPQTPPIKSKLGSSVQAESPPPISPISPPKSPSPQKASPQNHRLEKPTSPPSSPEAATDAIVGWAARAETPSTATAKMEEGGNGDHHHHDHDQHAAAGSQVVSGILRRRRRAKAVWRAEIGLRLSAAALCLVSFSVMAADKTAGWAGDSFDRYWEYRYCLSVNVIAFAYSCFQVCSHVHHLINKSHIIRPPIRQYFDFAMDQMLAYLLMSASSAAATQNDDWVTSFGSDEFTVRANGSISVSFLAFVALGVSSLISAYNLFSSSSSRNT